ncbi:hypothetical protein DLR30_20670 [Salmonella enterica subsp. enterica serovar Parkroyal]|nr:hypothetical protein [Salmonella enterica subsp. enterica serovar Parkroyal]
MSVALIYCLLIGSRLIGVYVMPLASPFYLLIGVGLINVDVMSLASQRILLFISTQGTHKSAFCVEINKFLYLSLLA